MSVDIGDLKLQIPIIGAAMDSVSSVETLRQLDRLGGMGVVNLCGLISRYGLSNYDGILKELVGYPSIATLQNIYNQQPIDTGILSTNLRELKDRLGERVEFAVSATPQYAERLFDIAIQYGIRVLIIQSSFISPYWSSKKATGLNVGKFVQYMHQNGKIVMVGNVASLNAAVPFIEADIDAIIEGVGPGVQCTTRYVLGIGAGHVTTIDDLREYIEKQKSKTKIIADGGIHTSGDIVKLLCCGAHAVILGGMIAKTIDAPFPGFHYGMSAFHHTLPRGTLLQTADPGVNDTIERLLMGPSDRADGTLALIPAIKNALSNLGCKDINSAYRDTRVTRFPGVATEGKIK